ncbi:hypothetical protein EC968_002386 [Mortierella alpina]|nr:hypothetical protein EC968_002386 [Mortierella alpina]
MQPVNTDVLERIKNLEISLKQHRDVEEQLRRTLQSTKQKHAALKRERASAAESWEAKQEERKSTKDELLAEIHRVLEEIQSWKELSTQWKQDLSEKAKKKAALEEQLRKNAEIRTTILQDRDETDREELEKWTFAERSLREEHEEFADLVEKSADLSVALVETFSESARKQQRSELRKLNKLIKELEAQVYEKNRSREIDETNAAELELLLEKVVERRIRVLRNDQEEALHHAEETEKTREQQADTASKERDRLEEIWTTLAQQASMEEYRLMEERDEVTKLDQTLQSLRSKIAELRR